MDFNNSNIELKGWTIRERQDNGSLIKVPTFLRLEAALEFCKDKGVDYMHDFMQEFANCDENTVVEFLQIKQKESN